MPYIIFAIDYNGMEEIRDKIRQDHRQHLSSVGEKLLGSGAMLSDDGSRIIGGLSILDTENCLADIRKETTVVKWRRRWLDGKFLEGA